MTSSTENATTFVTNPDEILFRQVVDSWVRPEGDPMSVAFVPTPKDELKLSTDRERATASGSYDRYQKRTGSAPAGTWGISVGEALQAHSVFEDPSGEERRLVVVDDAGIDGNHEDHASIEYPYLDRSKNQTRKAYERLGKELRRGAVDRGLLHPLETPSTD